MRNQRVRGGVSARSVALAAGLIVSLSAVRAEAQQTVTFTGAGGNSLWSNPLNWSPNVVPINSGSTQYVVVIPDNRIVRVDLTMPVNFAVNSISLSASGRIEVIDSRQVQVSSESLIRGQVSLGNGRIVTVRPPGAPAETDLNYTLSASFTGLYRSAGTSLNLFGASLTANNSGTLDLSSIQSLSLLPSTTSSQILANFGTIDLSNVTSLQVNPTSRVRFIAENSGLIRLNSLTSLENVDLQFQGGLIQFGAITSINNSSIVLNGGSFTLPSGTTSYSATSPAEFRSLGAGASLNLSSLQSLNVGSFFKLEANAGRLDLSNAQVTQVPNAAFRINASNAGVVDLSSATSLSGAEIRLASGAGLIAPNLTTLSRSFVEAIDGTTLSLPSLQQFNVDVTQSARGLAVGNNSSLTLAALTTVNFINPTAGNLIDGFRISANGNSRIDLPALTTLTPSHGIFGSLLTATNGGVIALNSMSAFNGSVLMNISGAGSRVELPALTNVLRGATINLTQGGTFSAPQFRQLINTHITNEGGTLDIAQPTSFVNSSLTLYTGTLTFAPTLTRIDWGSTQAPASVSTLFLRALNGATIRGSGVERIDTSGANGGLSSWSGSLSADTGALIDLPALTTVQTSSGATFSLAAAAGGRILLPSLTRLDSVQSIALSGVGSQIDLRNATARAGATNFNLTATNQGVLELAGLATLEADVLNLTATTGGTIRLPLYTQANTRQVLFNISGGGRVELPLLTGIRDSVVTLSDPQSALVLNSISAFERSTLSVTSTNFAFPQTLTWISAPNSLPSSFIAASTNATITAPGVTTIEYGAPESTGGTAIIRADQSSLIDLPAWTSQIIRGPQTLELSSNFNSLIRANALTTLRGLISLRASGGTIDLPSLTTIDASSGGRYSALGTDSNIRLNNLRTFTLGTQNQTFFAQNSGNIELASLDSFGPLNTAQVEASNSVIALPALTNLGSGTGRAFTASQNGRVSMPVLADLGSTTGVSFSASGALSVITLPALQSMGSGTDRRISLMQGGTFSAPSLTQLRGTDVSIDASGQLLVGILTSIDASTFTLRLGATYTLSGSVTSYSALNRLSTTLFQATDAGSTFSAPSITSLTFGSTAEPRIQHTIRASDGGSIDLSGVTTLTRVNGGILRLQVDPGGSLNLSSLNRLNGADLVLSGGSTLLTAPLQSIDGSSILALSGRVYSLSDQITAYSTLDRRSMMLFQTSGTSAELNLSSLTSLTLGTLDAPDQIFSISAISGRIVLSGLPSLTSVNNARLNVSASSGGVVNLQSLNSLSNIDLRILGNNSQVQFAPLTSISNGTIRTESGAQFVLPAAITEYQNQTGGQVAIFSATGAGSLINLSALRSLSFGSQSVPNAAHEIVATSGGTINLSGLTSLTRVNGGLLNLTANAATLTLPSLSAFNYVNFNYSSVNLALPSSVINLDESTFTATGAAITLPTTISTHSITDRGSVTALRAVGSGGRINALGLTTLRLGSISSPNATMTFQAVTGGVLDLRNLTSIELINNARLTVNLSGVLNIDSLPELNNTSVVYTQSGILNAAALNTIRGTSFTGSANNSQPTILPSLRTIDARGVTDNTLVSFTAGRFVFPVLNRIIVGSSTETGVVQRIRTTGAAIEFGSTPLVESVNQGALSFEINGGSITLPTATASPTTPFNIIGTSSVTTGLRLSGALNIVTTNLTDFQAQSGTVSFVAGSGLINLEAAGANLGTSATRSSNSGNFGIGQLRIGVASGPAVSVFVSDVFNNGQRGTTGREALYLFGGSALNDRNGLFLLSGSRLIIDSSTDVFASINGVMTNLRSLIPAGSTQVAFGGGFIVIPTPAAGLVLGLGTLLAARRKRAG